MKTIAAIATALAPGGVGIVRVSGPDAVPILRRLCPALPDNLSSHRLYRTWVQPADVVLDEVLAVVMRGPHSFTGDDVVEIHGHGGVVNMRRLLEAALTAGAALAAPGEFTRRAFLNGRMDLTQAEAVIDVISARSVVALDLAQAQLAGSLGDTIRDLREAVTVAVTLTEAAIDFSTEEHVYQLDHADLLSRIDAVSDDIRQLLGTYDAGRRVRDGVRVVLIGRPNAGKSTLFNALCGYARAIVTAVPGTTRDYVEEDVVLGGVPVQLVDTAGLRPADDEIERLGMARSVEQARGADLIVWVLDRSIPFRPAEAEMSALDGMRVVAAFNKTDLPSAMTAEQMRVVTDSFTAVNADRDGVGELAEAISSAARELMDPGGEGVVIARARHREALMRGANALARARETATAGMSHEFIALDLRLALDALGEIVGHVSVDDVLHRIFAEFCVGK